MLQSPSTLDIESPVQHFELLIVRENESLQTVENDIVVPIEKGIRELPGIDKLTTKIEFEQATIAIRLLPETNPEAFFEALTIRLKAIEIEQQASIQQSLTYNRVYRMMSSAFKTKKPSL